MADIALAILWHQHQPYYPDDVAGENPMPWVRLHGVKDYYGMALHLLEVPEMQCTINLVPSLLVQLLAYTEGGASDRFLDVSRVPADGLSEADSLFLLDHFFMANAERMILPYPRYAELFTRRGAGRNTAQQALRRFNERDFRDLQVWFNLTWIHPLAIERDDVVRTLRDQGRNYTEEDKAALLNKHLEILRQVLPLHRQLAERGQIELTTTPFYHPILPLLFDKQLAREAMPDVALPKHTAGYPEDAALHVARAVAQHEQLLGQAPHGMWPAEGSVCQNMLPLLAQHGIRWIATDEEILTASTHGHVRRDEKGHVVNPDRLYRAYKVREGAAELGIVFRDHALSDMIGFHYQRNDANSAIDHFFGCLHGISQVTPGPAPALVNVILDGENCWEHYPNGGVEFLRALYKRCAANPGVKPVRIGDYLEHHPPHDTLPHLTAGSWISHNFAIWIGHEEDNTAWDLLHATREHLQSKGRPAFVQDKETRTQSDKETRRQGDKENGQPTSASPGLLVSLSPSLPVSQSPLEKAWEELYIAEGSDWFWWYGEDHSSAQDTLFDYLFRKHLRNVYLLLGDEPPPELARAIKRAARRELFTPPRGFLDIKIDGRYTFFEWLNAGRYICQNERGTMAMATRGTLKELFFGFNLDRLFLRIDCEGNAKQVLSRYDLVRIGFVEPTGFEVRIRQPGKADQSVEFVRDGRPAVGVVPVGVDRIAELSVPFDGLGVKINQGVQFFVELQQDGQGRDRAPREGTISLQRPSADFEHIMWDV